MQVSQEELQKLYKILEYQTTYQKEYREKNKEKMRAYQKEYHKTYQEKNKEKLREYQREYNRKLREKLRNLKDAELKF